MKKVSFTENYHKCVDGLPIVQVAAYKLLQEGLLGTALKLGALGAGAYGLYNLDPTAVSNFFGNSDPNSTMSKIGNTLGRGLQGYQHTVQDVGNNLFGSEGNPVLGGEEYTRRHAFETNMERGLHNIDQDTDAQVHRLQSDYDNGRLSQDAYESKLNAVHAGANEKKGALYTRETTNNKYDPKFFGPGYGYDNQNNPIYQARHQSEINATNNRPQISVTPVDSTNKTPEATPGNTQPNPVDSTNKTLQPVTPSSNAPTNNSTPKNEYGSQNYEKKVDQHINQNSSLNQSQPNPTPQGSSLNQPPSNTPKGNGLDVAKSAAIGAGVSGVVRVGTNVVGQKLQQQQVRQQPVTHTPPQSPTPQGQPQSPNPNSKPVPRLTNA